ncbi:hypothetical protein AMTR_s00098p00075200 [Amborella trichopoda]|uniref:Uncharacterized protein n=1 Tax=Amborella trichopoda TaxID=13333 RepID=W1NYR5_AMBTC|nr:hypothetical protein AMTR_s00098p00075200 [Amborella trichopoda]
MRGILSKKLTLALGLCRKSVAERRIVDTFELDNLSSSPSEPSSLVHDARQYSTKFSTFNEPSESVMSFDNDEGFIDSLKVIPAPSNLDEVSSSFLGSSKSHVNVSEPEPPTGRIYGGKLRGRLLWMRICLPLLCLSLALLMVVRLLSLLENVYLNLKSPQAFRWH